MQQIRALLIKELRQSWDLFLLLLGGLYAVTLLFCRAGQIDDNMVTVLAVIPPLLMMYVPVASLSLTKRLFVSEQNLNTHHFLEALPIRRWWMFLVKVLLGCAVMLTSLLIIIGTACLYASETDLIESRFLFILLGRAVGFAAFVGGVCFFASFTGRFRNTVLLASLFGLLALIGISQNPMEELGPFALVDVNDLPYEREAMPWQSFFQCTALGLGLTLIGFWIALWRDGRLIKQLRGKMSLAEKCWSGLLLTTLIIGGILFYQKRPKEPFRFMEQEVISSQRIPLQILYLEEPYRQQAQELFDWLEPQLFELQKQVVVSPLPAINITLSRSLDGKTRDSAELESNDGILWRCNFLDPTFRKSDLAGDLIHSILAHKTKNHATLDPEHWFLDGFSYWWSDRNQEERVRLAAWMVREKQLNSADLSGWEQLYSMYDEGAISLGYSCVEHLEQKVGEEAVIRFARSLYSPTYHQDLRDTARRFVTPFSRHFRETTQIEYEPFVESWNQWLHETEPLVVPSFSHKLAVKEETIIYGLAFSSSPPKGGSLTLSHARLPQEERLVPSNLLKREKHFWVGSEKSQEHKLQDVYSYGQRVYLLLELELPDFPYSIPIEARRLAIGGE